MQFEQLQRREVITLLGGAAATWPLAARAQQAKLPTIGFLGGSTYSAASQRIATFAQRLRELGWSNRPPGCVTPIRRPSLAKRGTRSIVLRPMASQRNSLIG